MCSSDLVLTCGTTTRKDVEWLVESLEVLGAERDELRVALDAAEAREAALRSLLSERHAFPGFPGPGEGLMSTEEDYPAQEAWRKAYLAIDERITAVLASPAPDRVVLTREQAHLALDVAKALRDERQARSPLASTHDADVVIAPLGKALSGEAER